MCILWPFTSFLLECCGHTATKPVQAYLIGVGDWAELVGLRFAKEKCGFVTDRARLNLSLVSPNSPNVQEQYFITITLFLSLFCCGSAWSRKMTVSGLQIPLTALLSSQYC